MAAIITLKDMLRDMRSGNPFSLEYVSADRKRGTGGEWREIKSALLMASLGKSDRKNEKEAAKSKTANHIENDTINVMIDANRFPVCVHLRLIKIYNGKSVVW